MYIQVYVHACWYTPIDIHIKKYLSDYLGNRKIRRQQNMTRLKPLHKIIASPRASLCFSTIKLTTLRAEPAQSSGETRGSRAGRNHRQSNKWSIRHAANPAVLAAIRALPWHFLVCPGFPGILKETEIRSWCAPHAQRRDSSPGVGGKTGQISFWASKDLLRSQAGQKGLRFSSSFAVEKGHCLFSRNTSQV